MLTDSVYVVVFAVAGVTTRSANRAAVALRYASVAPVDLVALVARRSGRDTLRATEGAVARTSLRATPASADRRARTSFLFGQPDPVHVAGIFGRVDAANCAIGSLRSAREGRSAVVALATRGDVIDVVVGLALILDRRRQGECRRHVEKPEPARRVAAGRADVGRGAA